MYATVTTYHAKPGQQQQLVDCWQQVAGTPMQHQPGFKGASLLPETNSEQVLLISMWATEQDFQAWEKTDARQQARTRISEFCAEPPKAVVCGVGFHAHPTA